MNRLIDLKFSFLFLSAKAPGIIRRIFPYGIKSAIFFMPKKLYLIETRIFRLNYGLGYYFFSRHFKDLNTQT